MTICGQIYLEEVVRTNELWHHYPTISMHMGTALGVILQKCNTFPYEMPLIMFAIGPFEEKRQILPVSIAVPFNIVLDTATANELVFEVLSATIAALAQEIAHPLRFQHSLWFDQEADSCLLTVQIGFEGSDLFGLLEMIDDVDQMLLESGDEVIKSDPSDEDFTIDDNLLSDLFSLLRRK